MSKQREVRTRVKGVSKAPEITRRKIIDAAIDLFGRHGYRATSTEEIADYAGYGQATVFFHFKTKNGLLQACLEAARDRAFQTALPDADIGGVLGLIRKIDGIFADQATANFFSRMLVEQEANVDVQSIYSEFHAEVRQKISAELIRETGAAQEKADFIASAILSMSVGVHAEFRVEHAKYSRKEYGKMLALVSELLVEHLKSGSGSPVQ